MSFAPLGRAAATAQDDDAPGESRRRTHGAGVGGRRQRGNPGPGAYHPRVPTREKGVRFCQAGRNARVMPALRGEATDEFP